ncbi:hypothetical protein EN925_19635 [Mesorhizobium sp. M7A.F.Ca.US.006.04.2.1]|uniref:hypothetical protein n=1 Tax=unclassified Mesorhizobium TaxID=325217 RepID=UPI000FCA3722|nr:MULTISPECIES: hypothetical protein [unclassified Mesorhizobium]RUX75595.1 hypothetical protein EN990_13195 [Mesorhizobium sp. M7A.F.Ca.US.005.03.1.1]RUY17633.1 hypothetical protein EN991_07080 [Mesorhizobium sp. M7A.F.Ca.US.005.03.2.1]RVA02335.1 hypothetical protein EN938_19550 [Mesorhizobium sp. M7A.F.Ca.US.001.02.1.1]RVA10771.1 hypothetical protein EN932_18075 [Mesorhizobium sp. M7A.F.Ca.US.002.01.1.1]RVA88409.1 hypothetical protein EN925_19635 [Mesorhizobium sp. M7A.F.Ca.US.006.04.2.1]
MVPVAGTLWKACAHDESRHVSQVNRLFVLVIAGGNPPKDAQFKDSSVVNSISRAIILTAAVFLAVSAIWQGAHDACSPVAHYGLCQFSSNFHWEWLYDYQTLIAGLVALAGAWWGVRAINMQMRQEICLEAERLASRRAAARATLPLSLSLLSEYAEECASILRSLLDRCVDGSLPRSVKVKDFPTPPAEAIQAFKEMTEVSLPTDRETLAATLTKIQIQRSRISSIVPKRRPERMIVAAANLEEYILDAAEIYARSAALYDYARRKTEKIPDAVVTIDSQISALNNLGIFDELRERLVATLRRRAKQPD